MGRKPRTLSEERLEELRFLQTKSSTLSKRASATRADSRPLFGGAALTILCAAARDRSAQLRECKTSAFANAFG
jgi:hypothetical protein